MGGENWVGIVIGATRGLYEPLRDCSDAYMPSPDYPEYLCSCTVSCPITSATLFLLFSAISARKAPFTAIGKLDCFTTLYASRFIIRRR